MVEVLDMNGIQRSVAIFPQAVPVLVDDMRDNGVDFFVAPPVAENPDALIIFTRAFVGTLIVVMIIDAMGMLGMVAFAGLIMLQMLSDWVDAVGEGWNRTAKDVKNAFVRKEEPQGKAIPVLVDDENDELPPTQA